MNNVAFSAAVIGSLLYEDSFSFGGAVYIVMYNLAEQKNDKTVYQLGM